MRSEAVRSVAIIQSQAARVNCRTLLRVLALQVNAGWERSAQHDTRAIQPNLSNKEIRLKMQHEAWQPMEAKVVWHHRSLTQVYDGA